MDIAINYVYYCFHFPRSNGIYSTLSPRLTWENYVEEHNVDGIQLCGLEKQKQLMLVAELCSEFYNDYALLKKRNGFSQFTLWIETLLQSSKLIIAEELYKWTSCS